MRTAIALILSLAATAAAARPQISEKLIAIVPDGVELVGPPITDPDGKKVDNVSEVVFSADCEQVAYVVGCKTRPSVSERP